MPLVVMSITQPLQSYLLVVTCLGCTPYYHYVHFLQVRLFEDFSSGGSLCVIMATAFRVKADQSWYMCNVCVCVTCHIPVHFHYVSGVASTF